MGSSRMILYEPLDIEKTRATNWHALGEDDVLEQLKTCPAGLDRIQVEARSQTFGPNALPGKKTLSLFTIIFRQFINPLIYILLAAAIASAFIGKMADSLFIGIVIMINAAIGTVQEWKADRSADALRKMFKIFAHVRRSNEKEQVEAEELVPGDIVYLTSGDRVPADIRLLESNNLAADESLLTGESVAVNKHPAVLPAKTAIADRKNMVFAGSAVTSGRGTGVVVATALDTEVGKIAHSITTQEGAKPPLIIRMEKFIRQLGYVILSIALLLSIMLYYQGEPLPLIFFLVVALAVSAIPEGLPVSLTVALSVATIKMSRRNVIVSNLNAVESLGSCTLIASDKTGTLTVNQQTVKALVLPCGQEFFVTGEGYAGTGEIKPMPSAHIHGSLLPAEQDQQEIREQTLPGENIRDQHLEQLKPLVIASMLSSDASLHFNPAENRWTYHGDAMDVALLALGYKSGLDPRDIEQKYKTLSVIPYESEIKYAARFYRDGNENRVAVKGAVETVLEFCHTMMTEAGAVPLNKELIEKQALHLAENGQRVLGVAHGISPDAGLPEKAGPDHIASLTFLGLAGFIDPLRPEAIEAIQKCKAAGVEVAMITGDHPATAIAIGRELGIISPGERAVTGAEVERTAETDGSRFDNIVASARVFARVSPLQKLQIVDSMIRAGHFVAVTGDGVNDAPALRKANIGVAMGTGTDVAKDTASMIVTDDNFASIVAGIEEGRTAYANVRKVIYLLVSTGAAEVMLFMMAIVSGMPIPLVAVQLLWLNLVTNGIQDKALAFEASEPGIMKQPPRNPREGIFNPLMIKQLFLSGLVMSTVCFACWYWLINIRGWGLEEARNIILLLMVLFQNAHIFNTRSETVSILSIPLSRNPYLVLLVPGALGFHILCMHIPLMQRILSIRPIAIKEMFFLAATALLLILVMETFKLVRKKTWGG